jgi:hypothetical protein
MCVCVCVIDCLHGQRNMADRADWIQRMNACAHTVQEVMCGKYIYIYIYT